MPNEPIKTKTDQERAHLGKERTRQQVNPSREPPTHLFRSVRDIHAQKGFITDRSSLQVPLLLLVLLGHLWGRKKEKEKPSRFRVRKSHKKRKNKTFVRASSFEDVVCADSKYLVDHSCLTFNKWWAWVSPLYWDKDPTSLWRCGNPLWYEWIIEWGKRSEERPLWRAEATSRQRKQLSQKLSLGSK